MRRRDRIAIVLSFSSQPGFARANRVSASKTRQCVEKGMSITAKTGSIGSRKSGRGKSQ